MPWAAGGVGHPFLSSPTSVLLTSHSLFFIHMTFIQLNCRFLEDKGAFFLLFYMLYTCIKCATKTLIWVAAWNFNLCIEGKFACELVYQLIRTQVPFMIEGGREG